MPILHLSDGAGTRWPDLLNSVPIMVIYKHSSFCSASFFSRHSVRAFSITHPDILIFQVDVIRQRDLSDRIARDLGIVHASPQTIMVVGGQPVWTGSHSDVSGQALEHAFASVESGGPRTSPVPD